MQGNNEALSFLVMMAIMFVVTALEAVARRRKTREEIDEMGQAEDREEGERPGRTKWAGGVDEAERREAELLEAAERAERRDAALTEAAERAERRAAPEPVWKPRDRSVADDVDALEERSPLETTDLAAAAEEIREEGRRELKEAAARSAPHGRPEVPGGAEGPGADTAARGVPVPGRPAPSGRLRHGRRDGFALASLVAALRRDPHALRKAVLYREILGPPVCMREGGGGWEEPGITHS